MSNRLPIIEQLHAAAGDDQARARVLLACPDHILLKYGRVFLDACRDFEIGRVYVTLRRAQLFEVRDGDGLAQRDETLNWARLRLRDFSLDGLSRSPPSLDI